MTPSHALLASRIRQDLGDLGRVVERVDRAMQARRQDMAEPEILLHGAALNLHDVYTVLERTFAQIAATLDQSAPAGPDRHRELLRQMTVEIPGLWPRVLSPASAVAIDEYLCFRNVVRHNYTFQLEPERVESLAARFPSAFQEVSADLAVFAAFLDALAHDTWGAQPPESSECVSDSAIRRIAFANTVSRARLAPGPR